MIVRQDAEGHDFLQVNYTTGHKILLTDKLVGFKPAMRADKHLRQQVAFIQKLGKANDRARSKTDNNIDLVNNENIKNDEKSCDPEQNIEKTSIWDCVLLVVTQPKTNESLTDQINGIIHLTEQHGCPLNHWNIGQNWKEHGAQFEGSLDWI